MRVAFDQLDADFVGAFDEGESMESELLCVLILFALAREAPLARQKVIIDQDTLEPGGSKTGSMLFLIQ